MTVIHLTPKAIDFHAYKKKSDNEIAQMYETACNLITYYDNADSFGQSLFEKNSRLSAYQTKYEIEEFIQKFRPKLKKIL